MAKNTDKTGSDFFAGYDLEELSKEQAFIPEKDARVFLPTATRPPYAKTLANDQTVKLVMVLEGEVLFEDGAEGVLHVWEISSKQAARAIVKLCANGPVPLSVSRTGTGKRTSYDIREASR